MTTKSKLAIQLFNPMLYLFISFVPFTLTLQLREALIKLLSIWLCGEFSRFLAKTLASMAKNVTSFRSEEKSNCEISLLDLPDLALDSIFERLSPESLRSLSMVCGSLREQCSSDHLWERHLRERWGRVIGVGEYRRWEFDSPVEISGENDKEMKMRQGLFENLVSLFPFSLNDKEKKKKKSLRVKKNKSDSAMARFVSLQSGNLWFPAQVFNRENGHIGFMLSCYDAQLCYDSKTDTFAARYSPHGRRTMEENIEWERLRVPPLDTDPFTLHVSDCLMELRPGDHVEIQWRRNKEFPYGWWYGVVAHLETCDGDVNRCLCHHDDTVVLEFKQYNPGSRWRQSIVNRKDHCEKGNEVDGFYGGIRKIYDADEISRWNQFWPTQTLEQ